MKSRQQIEDSMKEMVVPAGSNVTYKTMFEILLDIRDLLMKQDDRGIRKEIISARRLEELRRIVEMKGNHATNIEK